MVDATGLSVVAMNFATGDKGIEKLLAEVL